MADEYLYSEWRHVPPISTKNNGFTGINATDAVLKLRSIDLYDLTYN